jgi:integrase
MAALAAIPEEEIWLQSKKSARKVGDLHQKRGYDSLRVVRKGGRRDALAINPHTAARLRAYLELAGHGDDMDGPLFRPVRPNGKRQEERRSMDPDAIDRVVPKFATALGLDRGYSAHSMRATFITTALENGAQLEDVQKAAGHRDSRHDEIVRSTRLQSRESRLVFCDVLRSVNCMFREAGAFGWFAHPWRSSARQSNSGRL